MQSERKQVHEAMARLVVADWDSEVKSAMEERVERRRKRLLKSVEKREGKGKKTKKTGAEPEEKKVV